MRAGLAARAVSVGVTTTRSVGCKKLASLCAGRCRTPFRALAYCQRCKKRHPPATEYMSGGSFRRMRSVDKGCSVACAEVVVEVVAVAVSGACRRLVARVGHGHADKRLAAGEHGPLLGVPLALKDNFSTSGIRTTARPRCSKIRSDLQRLRVQRLLSAGGVVVGKTNLDEFAMDLPPRIRLSALPTIPGIFEGAGRLVRRLGGGDGCPSRDVHPGIGYRRQHPAAGRAVRSCRFEADLWPG